MALIKVTKPFLFAVCGVSVIEFGVGVHSVSGSVAECALATGGAEESKDKKAVLPPITLDIYGRDLEGRSDHLDPAFVYAETGTKEGEK